MYSPEVVDYILNFGIKYYMEELDKQRAETNSLVVKGGFKTEDIGKLIATEGGKCFKLAAINDGKELAWVPICT